MALPLKRKLYSLEPSFKSSFPKALPLRCVPTVMAISMHVHRFHHILPLTNLFITERPLPCSSFWMRVPRLPVLLKIAAAAAAGALAIIFAARLRRDDAVASLRREIREAIAALVADDEDDGGGQGGGEGEGEESATPTPPSVLITGFRAHGKSSLVNTACRALAAEDGPLLLRAEASPPGGGTDGPRRRRRVKAVVSGAEGDVPGEDNVVELLDAPPLHEAVRLTRADIEAEIADGDPECVVLVLRCDAPAKERNAAIKRLPDISAAVRTKGLNLIIVLTFKKAMRSIRQAEELQREVSFRARTDCVYFIENYTWSNNGPNLRHPPVIRNDFETHFTVLTIIRQCLEFIKLNRSQSKDKKNGKRVKPAEPTLKTPPVEAKTLPKI